MKKIIILYMLLFCCFNSYSQVSVGIYTNTPKGIFHIDNSGAVPGNTDKDIIVTNNGFMGIGGIMQPQYKLDIENNRSKTGVGAIIINDGYASKGKTLISDAEGLGKWGYLGALPIVRGVIGGTGVNLTAPNTNWYDTGAYIDLPPGKWQVSVIMLMKSNQSPTTNNMFVRTTFRPDTDIKGAKYISAPVYKGISQYSLLNGMVIIHNTSEGIKRYTYWVGNSIGSGNLRQFGGTYWGENNITALMFDN